MEEGSEGNEGKVVKGISRGCGIFSKKSTLFFFFYFILLYNTVLVLPYIDMNPPRIHEGNR